MKFAFEASGSPDSFRRHFENLKSESKGILILTCVENNFSSSWLGEQKKDSFPVFGGVFPQVIYGKKRFAKGTVFIGFDTKPKTHLFDLSETNKDHFKRSIDGTLLDVFPEREDYKNKTLFVFVDGFSDNITAFIKRIFYYFGLAPNYIGGGAGKVITNEKEKGMFPCIINGNEVKPDSAVVAVVDLKTGIGVRHGWKRTNYSFLVTKTNKNNVLSIDWKPAKSYFYDIISRLQKTGKEVSVNDCRNYPWELKKWGTRSFASSNTKSLRNIVGLFLRFPSELKNFLKPKIQPEGLIRTAFYPKEDNSLGIVGGIDERAIVTILKPDKKSIIKGAKTARKIAERAFQDGTKYEGIFFVDCISRPRILTDKHYHKELRAVSKRNTFMIGILAIGEIGNTGKSYLEYYNKTAVVGMFGEKSAQFRPIVENNSMPDAEAVTTEERNEVTSILHEISISIKPELDSDSVLEETLNTYMSRLNLSYCGVYKIDGSKLDGTPIKFVPKVSHNDVTLVAALRDMEKHLVDSEIKYFSEPLVTEKQVPEGGFYYILAFPHIGALVLIAQEHRLSHYMVNQLTYVTEQLSEAYHASKNREAFKKFVPEQFLYHLHKKEITNIKLGDHVAQTMSIMFSDIRNFTLLSGYMTTEENFNFVNSFFKTIGPIVRNHKGFIDKYIGDAILALFDTSSDDAIEAGISMIHTLETYNQGRKRAGYKPVKIGIGINTGKLMIGTIGEYGRMESTVIGEAVNLASRIESMTKMYRVSFLVTENTILDLKNPDKFNFRMIEQKAIKGNIKPVTVFEIFSSDPPKIRDAKSSLAGIFEEAIPLYNLRKFEEAKQLFLQCMVKYPEDTVAQIYLERCNYHLHNETDSSWGSVANFYGKK